MASFTALTLTVLLPASHWQRRRPRLPVAFAPMLAKRTWPVREISITDLENTKALWLSWNLQAEPYLTIHNSLS